MSWKNVQYENGKFRTNEGGGGGGSSTLAGLDDVNMSSPANGQVLKYNNTTNKWENANESGGGSSTLAGLDDTNITNPLNGQILQYDAQNDEWINATNESAYTCELLFTNTDTSVASGTSNVTHTYTMTESIDNYDAIIVMGWMYYKGSSTYEHIATQIVNKSAYYEKNSWGGVDTPFGLDGSLPNYDRRLMFGFANNKLMYTVARRNTSGEEPKLYKVFGLKFGGGGGSSTLAGLDDVLLTSIANGQILQWDADSQKFVNKGKVNSDSVKTPQDSNSGQRLASRYIGAAGSSQTTFQFVKFTDTWQDLTGIIIHRHGLTSISYSINGSYSIDTSNTSYISGSSSSHMPTSSYDSSTHIISITLKPYEWAYFIGVTHGQFL